MRMLMRKLALGAVMVGMILGGSVGRSQSVVKNPTGLGFTSPDHSQVETYQVDIVRESGEFVQTLSFSNSPVIPLVGGEVVLAINVQPIVFGRYQFIARAVGGGVTSDDSLPSAVWERAPGRPTNLIVR